MGIRSGEDDALGAVQSVNGQFSGGEKVGRESPDIREVARKP